MDVRGGHLGPAESGVDLHLDLRVLHGLQAAALPQQAHRQVATLGRTGPLKERLPGPKGQGSTCISVVHGDGTLC